MTTKMPESYYIGWDVGGWNCDKNSTSRDAIVILDSKLDVVGDPWRGNLRVDINKATTAREWLSILFHRCKAVVPDGPISVTMAIDTPLGFSEEFVSLVTKGSHTGHLGSTSGINPYLFRYTERYLFEQHRMRPLSAIKDMIGSQATKGMHVLAKFAPTLESCGVWTDGMGFHAIEAYPSACRESDVMTNLLRHCDLLKDDDRNDARVCAMIAHLFATDRERLVSPPVDVPVSEGWIWIP